MASVGHHGDSVLDGSAVSSDGLGYNDDDEDDDGGGCKVAGRG